tara:strand:- start:43 stop:444 length:402 start_codon:yes stop_codon:yes gene_type:complete
MATPKWFLRSKVTARIWRTRLFFKIQIHEVGVEGDLYERDKGELIKDYVANFYPWMIGLRGDTAQTKAVTDAYRMHAVKVCPEGAAPDKYPVNQSLITFSMGPVGEPVALFPHDTSSEKITTVSAKNVVARGS